MNVREAQQQHTCVQYSRSALGPPACKPCARPAHLMGRWKLQGGCGMVVLLVMVMVVVGLAFSLLPPLRAAAAAAVLQWRQRLDGRHQAAAAAGGAALPSRGLGRRRRADGSPVQRGGGGRGGGLAGGRGIVGKSRLWVILLTASSRQLSGVADAVAAAATTAALRSCHPFQLPAQHAAQVRGLAVGCAGGARIASGVALRRGVARSKHAGVRRHCSGERQLVSSVQCGGGGEAGRSLGIQHAHLEGFRLLGLAVGSQLLLGGK